MPNPKVCLHPPSHFVLVPSEVSSIKMKMLGHTPGAFASPTGGSGGWGTPEGAEGRPHGEPGKERGNQKTRIC